SGSARSRTDWMDLAHMVTLDGVGEFARAALIEGLDQDPLPEGLGDALEQAQFLLRSSGTLVATEAFEGALRRKTVRAKSPLTERVLSDTWAKRSLLAAGATGPKLLGASEAQPPR
ncbi:MAG: hypothetical protein KDB61_14625, partial [Planctomycetes bacterium]|nr:hypothetical protein [Planctomycetota bacterium]